MAYQSYVRNFSKIKSNGECGCNKCQIWKRVTQRGVMMAFFFYSKWVVVVGKCEGVRLTIVGSASG